MPMVKMVVKGKSAHGEKTKWYKNIERVLFGNQSRAVDTIYGSQSRAYDTIYGNQSRAVDTIYVTIPVNFKAKQMWKMSIETQNNEWMKSSIHSRMQFKFLLSNTNFATEAGLICSFAFCFWAAGCQTPPGTQFSNALPANCIYSFLSHQSDNLIQGFNVKHRNEENLEQLVST